MASLCRRVRIGREFRLDDLGDVVMAVGSVETSWTLLPDTGSTEVRVVELRELVSWWRGPGTLVLVTHALTVGRLAEEPRCILSFERSFLRAVSADDR